MSWVAVGSAAAGLLLGNKQRQDARAAGRTSAETEAIATEERVRRLGIERRNILGAQRTGAAAGGVDVTSKSVIEVQTETMREMSREIQFVRRAGAFAAESAELRGRAASYQGLASMLENAGQIFSLVQERRAGRST